MYNISLIIKEKQANPHVLLGLKQKDFLETVFKTNLFSGNTDKQKLAINLLSNVFITHQNYVRPCNVLIIVDIDEKDIYFLGWTKEQTHSIDSFLIKDIIKVDHYKINEDIEFSEKKIKNILEVGIIDEKSMLNIIHNKIEWFIMPWSKLEWDVYFYDKTDFEGFVSLIKNLLHKGWILNDKALFQWQCLIDNHLEYYWQLNKKKTDNFKQSQDKQQQKSSCKNFFKKRIEGIKYEYQMEKLSKAIDINKKYSNEKSDRIL